MSKRLREGAVREGGALREGNRKYARERGGGEKPLHVKVASRTVVVDHDEGFNYLARALVSDSLS